ALGGPMVNRLANETSPYLLQHKDNPVDWYPWGEEALERARREDKPILLSIGYAACHWCHVMEHESFEDAATADIMNRHYVNVKVDREERPDLDAVYMEAVQTMTGQGGWPMTVFLTPDGRPFYGGTYFPKEDRHGMPAFKRVLLAVAQTWRERRGDIEQQGHALASRVGALAHLPAQDQDVPEGIIEQAVAHLSASFDRAHGGFGGAPKFPQPMVIDFLLSAGARGVGGALDMAETTLEAMAAGGIFDQVGGGFHRYAVDREWVVPHFEKMLYDNAQLIRTYVRSHLVTGKDRHRQIAEATVSWLFSEMWDEGGGFYSSLDADSEGEEGKFYVWSLDEVRDITGDDFEEVARVFGMTEAGNFEGRNIPVRAAEPHDGQAFERARDALKQARDRRLRPATDTKVLTAWNGLTASALAEAGAALDHRQWVDAARRVTEFLLSAMRVDGRLMRSYRQGDDGRAVVKQKGFAEDYASVLEACLALYEATFEPRWIDEARGVADQAMRLFLDEDGGGFFTTGSDAEKLVARTKELVDNAVPAANSVFALELQRLAALTGERRYEDEAHRIIRILAAPAARSPLGFGNLLMAAHFYLCNPPEIVIAAKDPLRSELTSVARRHAPVNRIIAGTTDGASASIGLLEGREMIGGADTAYVCYRGICKQPVTNPTDLVRELSP
ncbi:MAG TPA: thioredoxin domain-containing protein, partial [Actinomycetota bacterium]|nr:thioredoxin domain-containing protein [Actinomycetota bacterium]